MNYRHIYHAGNFADVFKHIVLVMVLDYLRRKDKPFFVLDTHAGIGRYDLRAEEAQKTGEAEEGIGRLWRRKDLPEQVRDYVDIVRKINRGTAELKTYPGSPLIIRELLRRDDRFVANELHPEDQRVLRQILGGDARIRVERDDGYVQMRAKLPPHERRGAVLIDPPFEVTDEFDRMVKGLEQAYERWTGGIYMFWYPIKDMKPVRQFHKNLQKTGIPDIIAANFLLRAPDDPDRLNGCGLAIVNPPWTLEAQLATIGPWLAGILTGGQGKLDITRIAGEKK